MDLHLTVALVVAALCLAAVVITWRLTDPLFDEQVQGRLQALERAEFVQAENEGLRRDRALLRNQVLASGQVPLTDSPISKGRNPIGTPPPEATQ